MFMSRYIKRGHGDRYADGITVTPRRMQKAEIIAETIGRLLSQQSGLVIVDFGCADGAIPVMLLRLSIGASIAHITGITLLNYNDLLEKKSHTHSHFNRIIADLEMDLDNVTLPWGQCDIVIATAFFHYLTHPEVAFAHARRLLKPGGYLLAGMPARWVLFLRRCGIPGILPPNNYIRHIKTLNDWRTLAVVNGLSEVSRQAVQWFGCAFTAAVEKWMRHNRLLKSLGSNYLVIYRRID